MPTILHLGRSDIFGYGLEHPERDAWPYVLGERLRQQTGLPIVTELRRLNMQGDPSDYLAKVFAEVRPDVVTFTVTPYDYATAHVQQRLNERAGKRIGDIARAIEKKTLPKDKTSQPGILHKGLRRLARRYVGTAPKQTRADVMFTTDRIYRFMASQEVTAIVVKASIHPPRALTEANPEYLDAVQHFRAEWKEKALARHFHWTDTNVDGRMDKHRLSDGLHYTVEGHRHIADDLHDAVFAALCDIHPELRELKRAVKAR